MLPTLEYVTDGVIFDSQQDPHQPAPSLTTASPRRSRERISRTIGSRGAPPMVLENAAVYGASGEPRPPRA